MWHKLLLLHIYILEAAKKKVRCGEYGYGISPLDTRQFKKITIFALVGRQTNHRCIERSLLVCIIGFALDVVLKMRLARAPFARQRDHAIIGIAEHMQQLLFCIANRHEFTSA